MVHHGKTEWHERFYLYRQHDTTGYSGTGVVGEGIRFSDGTCALRWCVPDKPKSTVVYESVLDVAAIHGHNGSTLVMWMDEYTEDNPEPAQVTGTAHANVGALVAA